MLVTDAFSIRGEIGRESSRIKATQWRCGLFLPCPELWDPRHVGLNEFHKKGTDKGRTSTLWMYHVCWVSEKHICFSSSLVSYSLLLARALHCTRDRKDTTGTVYCTYRQEKYFLHLLAHVHAPGCEQPCVLPVCFTLKTDLLDWSNLSIIFSTTNSVWGRAFSHSQFCYLSREGGSVAGPCHLIWVELSCDLSKVLVRWAWCLDIIHSRNMDNWRTEWKTNRKQKS